MHEEAQKEVRQLVRLFENALAGLVLDGQWKTFTESTPEQQDARIRAWQQSRYRVRRTGYKALKKIVYSSYYGARETWAAIGYPGPPPTGGPVEREPRFVPGHRHRGGSPAPGPPPQRTRGETVSEAPGRIVDAASLRKDVDERPDVCVVGSGAGGAVVAARLAARGLRVTCSRRAATSRPTRLKMDESWAYPEPLPGAGNAGHGRPGRDPAAGARGRRRHARQLDHQLPDPAPGAAPLGPGLRRLRPRRAGARRRTSTPSRDGSASSPGPSRPRTRTTGSSGTAPASWAGAARSPGATSPAASRSGTAAPAARSAPRAPPT